MATPNASPRDDIPVGILGLQGRNGSDNSFLIPDRQCVEARNVDWYRSGGARRRGGASALSTAGGTAAASGIVSLFRHVPGFDQTLAEFWSVDGASQWHRLAASVTWADPTIVDAIQTAPQEVTQVSFNGLSYFAYDSAHNRLHCWDPATSSVRRCGLDLPAAPTTGAPSGGAVTATRKYAVCWTRQVSGVTILRSNLGAASASVALVAQQVVVTRPALPGESETHWELYEAQDALFADFRLVATTVVATTTATDNLATQSVTTAPASGANTPPPSARYIVSDDARIIMGGAWETAQENSMAPSVSRVWWTSVLNSGTGDGERVSNTGTINAYADVEEAITGISKPMQIVSAQATSLDRGSFFVFSYEGHWKFVSTGDTTTPYLRFRVTGGRGAIHHKSIVIAEDVNGNPTVMWASPTGLMRISTTGQEFVGEDNVDIWERINLDATIPCHAVFYPAIHQVWFWVALDGSAYPNFRLTYDTRLGRVTSDTGVRYGWSTADGESTKAYCSCLFSNTVAASMGRSLKPYIGYTGSTAIWKCDTSDMDDGGTTFQAYVDTKSYAPWGLGRKGGLRSEALVLANAQAGTSIALTIYRDEGVESMNFKADISPRSDSEAETKVLRKFDGSRLSDSFSLRLRFGDAAAITTTWNVHGLVMPWSNDGEM